MYHAPTDCATIRKWLTKCADDSETANYISAHTKDVRTSACKHTEMRMYCNCCLHTLVHLHTYFRFELSVGHKSCTV